MVLRDLTHGIPRNRRDPESADPAHRVRRRRLPDIRQAQGAVEHLVKHNFSIQDVTIVGSDLQLVERVTGRLTAGKLAAAGAASGAWMGLFVGLLMFFFSPGAGRRAVAHPGRGRRSVPGSVR